MSDEIKITGMVSCVESTRKHRYSAIGTDGMSHAEYFGPIETDGIVEYYGDMDSKRSARIALPVGTKPGDQVEITVRRVK